VQRLALRHGREHRVQLGLVVRNVSNLGEAVVTVVLVSALKNINFALDQCRIFENFSRA
jgi:hypothetical protein